MTITSRKTLSNSATSSQIARLAGQLSSQLPAKKLSGDAAQFWIRNPKKVKKLLSLLSSVGDSAELIPIDPMFETLSELVESIGSGKLLYGNVLKGLKSVARGVETIAWPVWKTVQVGRYKTNKGLRSALFKRKSLSEYIAYTENEMVKGLSLGSEKRHLTLVLILIEELGFTRDPTYLEALEVGKQLGLKPCPPETAACICLQHDRILPWSRLGDDRYAAVAMEPIQFEQRRGKLSTKFFFSIMDSIKRHGFPKLRVERAGEQNCWPLHQKIIFSV